MKYLSVCTLLFGLLTSLLVPSWAADEPLLQPGKTTLYQRVLTLPAATLAPRAGAKGTAPLMTFSRYYVYQTRQSGGNTWLKIGPDRFGNTVGWVKQSDTIAWYSQLTLLLTNPANRQPLLFFDSAAQLEPLIESEQAPEQLDSLLTQLDQQGSAPGVLAKEPKFAVNFQDNFYLIPVLSAEERYLYDGNIGQLLKVASVSAKPSQTPVPDASPDQSSSSAAVQTQLLRGFRAAVVFVIDSTISMGPYIERTRQAVQQIYQRVEQEQLLDQVKFGLVAYRSNMDRKPRLEYVSRFYASPDSVKDSEEFLAEIADLKPAVVSTPRFDEDAYAGIMQALEDIDWTGYGGRYLVLITDAGALRGEDPLSSTQLSAKAVRLEAAYRGVAIYALHLKTAAGRRNHASAERQYTELSFNPVLNKPLYYDVAAGNVKQFGRVVDQLADAIVTTVQQAYSGETVAGSAASADPEFGKQSQSTTPAAGQSKPPVAGSSEQQLAEDTARLGYAMQLEYLGTQTGAQAPDSFQAWIVDRDLANPSQKTVEARILLTKSQLSDLSEVVQEIYDAAGDSIIAPSTFFNRLISLAATMGRDPNQLSAASSSKLAELGLLGEYLQELPYKSDVMGLDAETWEAWSASQQETFIRSLGNKLRYYRLYNQDVDRWIGLAEGSDPRDHVYPVPLEALP